MDKWVGGWMDGSQDHRLCNDSGYHSGTVSNGEVKIVICELQKNWRGSGSGIFQDTTPAFTLSD
jgi:hypothetical protein